MVEKFSLQVDDDHRRRAVGAVQNLLPAGCRKGLDLFFNAIFFVFLCRLFRMG